ncbi:MAG: hypothetical protein WC873_04500 [Candidatus Gracilibacteria bacterium]
MSEAPKVFPVFLEEHDEKEGIKRLIDQITYCDKVSKLTIARSNAAMEIDSAKSLEAILGIVDSVRQTIAAIFKDADAHDLHRSEQIVEKFGQAAKLWWEQHRSQELSTPAGS